MVPSAVVTALLTKGLDPLTCADDESIRRRSDIRKRVTRDERQGTSACRLEHLNGAWRDDGCRFHHVLELAGPGFQRDRIAGAYAAQRAKERVAMAREDDIAHLAWQRGVGQVSDAASKSRRRLTLRYHRPQPKPRNLNFANRRAVGWYRRGDRRRRGCFEACALHRLILTRVDDDIRGEPEGHDTARQQDWR